MTLTLSSEELNYSFFCISLEYLSGLDNRAPPHVYLVLYIKISPPSVVPYSLIYSTVQCAK